MTANVITMWYRPLELLFGADHYSGGVDMWSIGCVYAELLLRRPFIVGQVNSAEEIDTSVGHIAQIEAICKIVGTPNETNWPGVTKLKDWFEPKRQQPQRDKSHFLKMLPMAGPSGVDFIMRLLTLNPRKRSTAKEILQCDFWKTDPRPTDIKDLPKKGGGGIEAMAAAEVKKPGTVVVDEEKLRGVARKLDFGGAK